MRSSASPTRRSRARRGAASSRSSSAGSPRCASRRSTRRSRSTMRARCPACARSTATRCSSRPTSRARACSRRSPAATCSARWRARWSSTTATRSPSTRWAAGRFDSAQWRRSSLIVLERNPDYRDMRYDAEPAADDAEGPGAAREVQGPAAADGRPRRGLDHRGAAAALARVPERPDRPACRCPASSSTPRCRTARSRPTSRSAASAAIASCSPTPRSPTSTWSIRWSAATRPTRSRCAARSGWRSTSIARSVCCAAAWAIPAHSPIPPHTIGYDPSFKSENGDHDPARAKALLDLYGYVDRDGDGWRDLPDGSPLVLELATQPDQISRQSDELWQKNMAAIGVRLRFDARKWPEQLKLARNGKLMMWTLGSTAAAPDGQGALARYHGPQAGGQNLARFKLPRSMRSTTACSACPTGPSAMRCFVRRSCCGGVHAVQDPRAPVRRRHGAPMGARFSAPGVLAGPVAVHRHRPGVARTPIEVT